MSTRKSLFWKVGIATVLLLACLVVYRVYETDPENISSAIHNSAEKINQKCPMLIERDLSLESAEVLDDNSVIYKVVYTYTTDTTFDKASFERKVKVLIQNFVQDLPESRTFRKYNVSQSVFTYDKNGEYLTNF